MFFHCFCCLALLGFLYGAPLAFTSRVLWILGSTVLSFYINWTWCVFGPLSFCSALHKIDPNISIYMIFSLLSLNVKVSIFSGIGLGSGNLFSKGSLEGSFIGLIQSMKITKREKYKHFCSLCFFFYTNIVEKLKVAIYLVYWDSKLHSRR